MINSNARTQATWSFIIVKTALTKATLKLTKQPALSWDLLNKFWLWPLRLELHLYVYLHVKTWHQNGIFIFGISSELLSSETLHPFHTTLIPSRFCQAIHGRVAATCYANRCFQNHQEYFSEVSGCIC
ncbi:hypothetical protein ACOSQ4_016519 [Xanthoceras sorbifolium]